MELRIINDACAKALAVYCRRMTFDDAFRKADGETEDERTSMAYRILRAMSDIEACLEQAGFSSQVKGKSG